MVVVIYSPVLKTIKQTILRQPRMKDTQISNFTVIVDDDGISSCLIQRRYTEKG